MKQAAALPLLLLAACSRSPEAPSPTPSPVVTPDKPHTLVPADFATLKLGAKVAGSDATGKFVSDGQVVAEVESYVACPEGVTACDPEALPAGTVYTYVHRVVPGKTVASATLFRTARPAGGFANGVGIDNSQAAAALGPDGQVDVAADNGALVWRVIGGDGWKAGEPITFFWQSTLPPALSTEAYLVETDGSVAMGSGPFPTKEKTAEPRY
uniref:hypothetical protein n=1 Tax=Altererythrobacter segetis TaxID=1104773 RepID=UPI001FAFFF9A|nr:hypothetical protein [Altererythrobacter segetis]